MFHMVFLGMLWYRAEVTENDTYPEGTEWKEQQSKALHISCGPRNQVWLKCREHNVNSKLYKRVKKQKKKKKTREKKKKKKEAKKNLVYLH